MGRASFHHLTGHYPGVACAQAGAAPPVTPKATSVSTLAELAVDRTEPPGTHLHDTIAKLQGPLSIMGDVQHRQL
jgi:hypothetical protein